MTDEQVLAIPTRKAMSMGVRPGFNADPATAKLIISATESMAFWPRSDVEQDPSWLQLIPYCLLIDDASRVFCYRRHKDGGESRLHEKCSVGIGGHINPQDASVVGSEYQSGLLRE